MKQIQYRFNRANGKIFQCQRAHLQEIGESLDTIILHATEPIFGDPFEQNRSQEWVQLCFLDHHLNWCYAMLNSGNSGALNNWYFYQQKLEKAHQNLWEVTTKISLIQTSSSYNDNIWYYYDFENKPLSPDINIPKILKTNRHLPLVDTSLNLNFTIPDHHPLLSLNNIDERAKFVCWQ